MNFVMTKCTKNIFGKILSENNEEDVSDIVSSYKGFLLHLMDM